MKSCKKVVKIAVFHRITASFHSLFSVPLHMTDRHRTEGFLFDDIDDEVVAHLRAMADAGLLLEIKLYQLQHGQPTVIA